jgi:23S rRNA U2552 (ribose-2'-O)-methylase RlmE/FtsJ
MAEDSGFGIKKYKKIQKLDRPGLGFKSETTTQQSLAVIEPDEEGNRSALSLMNTTLARKDIVWQKRPILSSVADWAAFLRVHYPKTATGKQQLDGKLRAVKSKFDVLDEFKVRDARSKANPFEAVMKAGFQNRAAVKLAELDYLFDFELVKKNKETGLLFAGDLCGGPGGFSEYILWHRKWKARVLGLTLRNGTDDFQPGKFRKDAPSATFRAVYGPSGTGDIYDARVRSSFIGAALEVTQNVGLHLVVADGGFSVAGQENDQERLSSRLVACQLSVGLAVLREGGWLVCKLFDCWLPITQQLIYLFCLLFEATTVVKPLQSRPANSERYIVCKGLKARPPQPVMKFLESLCCLADEKAWTDNLHIWDTSAQEIPKAAVEWLAGLNETFGQRQLTALERQLKYACSPFLSITIDRDDICKTLLQHWQIPEHGTGAQYGEQLICYTDGSPQRTTLGSQVLGGAIYGLRTDPTDHVQQQSETTFVFQLPAGGTRALFIKDCKTTDVLARSGIITPKWLRPTCALPDTVLDVWIPLLGETCFVLDAWFLPLTDTAEACTFTQPVEARQATVKQFVTALAHPQLQYIQPLRHTGQLTPVFTQSIQYDSVVLCGDNLPTVSIVTAVGSLAKKQPLTVLRKQQLVSSSASTMPNLRLF